MSTQRKNKVFIDAFPISSDRVSGIGYMELSLLRELDKNEEDFEIYLVASRYAINRIKAKHNFNHIKYKALPLPGRIFNGLILKGLMFPVDFILGRGVYIFPNFTTWPLAHSKSITYIHDMAYKLFPETLRPNVEAALSANVPKWAKQATIIATVSQSAKKDIVSELGVSPEKVAVVFNGVDTALYYRRKDSEIEEVSEKYNLPKNYFLFLSSIEPRKGIDTLVDAYVALQPNVKKQIGLVLVGGEGWGTEALQGKIQELISAGENIHIPDQYVEDSDLPAVMSGATALVHPAIYEGFGTSPLQALAVGIPTIVADNSSLSELYSKSSLLFETGNVERLTKLMATVAQGSSVDEQMQSATRELVEAYSWEASARALKELILRLTLN